MSAPERNGQEEKKLSTTAAANGIGAVETVAENSVDGVMSVLFFASKSLM